MDKVYMEPRVVCLTVRTHGYDAEKRASVPSRWQVGALKVQAGAKQAGINAKVIVRV